MGRVSKYSDETYISGVFSDKNKAIAQMNWVNDIYNGFDYKIEEREI